MTDSKKIKQKADKLRISELGILILLIAQCVITVVMPSRCNCNAVVFSILFSIISMILILSRCNNPKINTSQKVYAFFFSVLYLFMLSIFDIINFSLLPYSQNNMARILLVSVFSLAIIAGFYVFITNLFSAFIKEKCLEKPDNGNLKVYYRIIIIVSFIFFIAGGNGFSTPDATTIFALATENNWHEWHTLPYEMFVKICLLIYSDKFFLFPVLIIQFMLWCMISFYAINSLYDEFKNIKVIKSFITVFCLVFTPFVYIMITVKDTIFSMFMYSFAISIFNFVRVSKLKKKEWICLALNATLASLFRHAAIEIVVVSIIIVLLVRLFKDKSKKDIIKYICVAITPIIIYSGIVTGIGQGILHATKNPAYVKYTMPLFLSAAVATKTGEGFEQENVDVLEEVMPLDEWKSSYKENIYWADTVSRTWGGIGKRVFDVDDEYGKKIVKMNASMLIHHPKEYLESFMEISSIIWRISNPKNCEVFYPDWKELSETETYRSTIAGDIVGEISDFTMKNAITDAFLWRGGLWILFALFSSYVLFKKKKKEYTLMIVPIVLFVATLFFSIPAQDPRYILSFIEVGTFFGIVAYFTPENKQKPTEAEQLPE